MNATEFFAALTAVPGARAAPVGANGIAESRFIAGVEIAHAASPVLPRSSAAIHRQRHSRRSEHRLP
jgi:hypothetical protein